MFRSFWIAGYESATHRNADGERLDMIAGIQHDTHVCEDYRLLHEVGIHTARDGVRWHLIDKGGGRYDFSSLEPMLNASISQGVEVIWDLCHYGYPGDIDLFTPEFINRFERFAKATAKFVREHTDEIPFYSPMNEISFFAWGASRDFMYPCAQGKDDCIKLQLCRAAIQGAAAIREVDPRARLSYPEPTICVHAPHHRPDLRGGADNYTLSQFEAWDIIAGIARPEFGGKPEFLDIPGSNFYHSNQWEIEGQGRLRWEENPRDARWVPYHLLLEWIWERYRRPLYVSETSHFGSGRAQWLTEISDEVLKARARGVPVEGVCLYPIVDRHDWLDPNHWHNSGLWDLEPRDGRLHRVLNEEYAAALSTAQKRISRTATA